MVILASIIIVVFALWAAYGLIEHLRDRRFTRATRNPLHENWRQVPPPNWRSARGGVEYW